MCSLAVQGTDFWIELTLTPVVVQFGKFMKVVVVVVVSEHELEMNQSLGRNLVDVMRQAQQDLDLPSPLNEVYICCVKGFEPAGETILLSWV